MLLTKADLLAVLDDFDPAKAETCLRNLANTPGPNLDTLRMDHAEAEDLALEAFLKLHRKISGLNQVEVLSTSGWLYRVATNLGLNALRARKRRQQQAKTAAADSATAQPEAAD
mgnify:CR=1 FL=1